MSRVIASGQALPSQSLTNDQLIDRYGLDSSHDWIYRRTGIKERSFVEEESAADLAFQAAQAAFEAGSQRLGCSPQDLVDDLRLILVASMSSGGPSPNLASQVQGHLGASRAWGFDLNAACSGFVVALETANALSQNYNDGYTLVIGVETMSHLLDFKDRSSCILFGDGAGAILLANDGQALPNYRSYLRTQADMAQPPAIAYRPGSTLGLEGRQVFDFVVRQVLEDLGVFIEESQFEMDYLLSHQANERFLTLIKRRLDLPDHQVPSNIAQVANTSAASIPILLDTLVAEGTLTLDGQDHMVLAGYGGGLTWGFIEFTI